MMSKDDSQSIKLKVLVEKEKNRVVLVESDKDFFDVLFSFMTMPMGNIVRLAREHSLGENFGCLNNIYEGIENLDEVHLQSVKCKDMLLRPRSAAEIYCRNLKLNFFDTNDIYAGCVNYSTTEVLNRVGGGIISNTRKHFTCMGPYYNARCGCGLTMNTFHKLRNKPSAPQGGSSVPQGGVFVKPTADFLISDDFQVKPISTAAYVALLSKFEDADRSTREKGTIVQRIVEVEMDKVIKLISCSLTTKAPFSKVILESEIGKSSFCVSQEKCGPRSTIQPERARARDRDRDRDATTKETKIVLTLIINKSNNKLLYVEAKTDFINLIGSFLTYPLGFMFEKLPCLSLRGCLGSLYKSIQDLDVVDSLKSEEMKAILVNPKLPRGLALHKQLIPIEEASYPSCSTAASLFNISEVEGPTHPVEAITGNGFFRGPTIFMVTDDLTITPLSSMSLADKLNICLSDILEKKVTVGEVEALHLLEAALVSKTALTDVFLPKKSKRKLYDDSKN